MITHVRQALNIVLGVALVATAARDAAAQAGLGVYFGLIYEASRFDGQSARVLEGESGRIGIVIGRWSAGYVGKDIRGGPSVVVVRPGTILTLESVVSQVTGGVLAYSAWLGFSGSVFGAPIFILPFPPFIIFAWRELDEQTHVQIRHRWLALAVLAAVIMLFRYALSGFRALGV